ncbi:rCG37338 [Rattus norvegicus]|uniref:RCG37338 n=1 Tax=Rattus norvegicus TaxID=10116 RepID=A6KIB6_RAT|nr:rCG37338 [Rattus norvegicus]
MLFLEPGGGSAKRLEMSYKISSSSYPSAMSMGETGPGWDTGSGTAFGPRV